MDSSNKVIIVCICFCGLVSYAGCTLDRLRTFTTTRRPPMAVDVDSNSLMKAGRMKNYGGIRKVVTEGLIPEAQKHGGCRRRVIRRYIGDSERNCTSLRPYPITWCEGVCIPQKELAKTHPLMRYKEFLQKNSKSYECVEDRVVRRRVEIFCHDDQLLHVYRINVVKTCRCKQVEKNETSTSTEDEKQQSSENNSNVNQQAKRFSHRLHNLQNRLRKVQ